MLSGLLALGVAADARADEKQAFEEALPSESNLAHLKQRIDAEPGNLDHYFAYALMARHLRKYAEAAWALEQMLAADPSLDRVRLDLATVYTGLHRFDEAKALYARVLANSPPPAVEANVQQALAVLEERTRRHILGGSFTAGMHADTNANAAPSSGQVTIVDTSIPLDITDREDNDIHAFSALTLTHTYRGDDWPGRAPWKWQSSVLAYGTEQHDLDTLNIRLYSFRTGPEIALPDSASRLALTGHYSHIYLDGHTYLTNPRGELLAETMLPGGLIFGYRPSYEYREYANSPTNTTYRSRTGRAWQHVLEFRQPLSEREMVQTDVTVRREQARELYYANYQTGLSASYTRVFDDGIFAVAGIGCEMTDYDQPDLLISLITRRDFERTASLTLGRTLESEWAGAFLVSAGYQFRDVQSTIENYAYHNHRFSLSVTKNF